MIDIVLIILFLLVIVLSTFMLRNILDSFAAGQKEISRKRTCFGCRSRIDSSKQLWASLDEEQKNIIRETNQEVVTRSLTKSRFR